MIYNFSAGPAVIYEDVLKEIQEEFLDYKGMGYSIIEASHRGKHYSELHEEAQTLLKRLLGLDDEFNVLFLGGGATLQFSMLPLNFISHQESAQYVLSGSWARTAIENAKKIGNVKLAYDGSEHNFTRMPRIDELQLHKECVYLHITSNETIGGIQWKNFPYDVEMPLVADMSSDIMSRSFDAKKFSLIYASTQKNLGAAGLTVVIIRKDFLEKAKTNEHLPDYLTYREQAKTNSLLNTPPVFSVWVLNKILKKIERLGGLEKVERLNSEKAKILYDAIDASNGFYYSPIDTRNRSDMNVIFRLKSPELEHTFLTQAEEMGLIGLKGHRSLGGCRASIYNGMQKEGVKTLAAFMRDFEKLHA